MNKEEQKRKKDEHANPRPLAGWLWEKGKDADSRDLTPGGRFCAPRHLTDEVRGQP